MNKQAPSNLASVVSIKEQFARSTRIDKDDIEKASFIYSQSIDGFLKTLIKHQQVAHQGAFTWTGPYGSGKSTLALSFSSILVGTKSKREKAAKLYDKETADQLWQAFPPRQRGWKVFSIVGNRTDLETLIESEIAEQLTKKNPNESITETRQRQVAIIEDLENYLSQNEDLGGIILLIDEMGKLLEAASDGLGDVYFYQLLAEAASRSNGRLVIIGILHQSFQEYASTATKRVRDEWGKIHGRFVDISINLTSSEQIELIASAISSSQTPSYAQSLSNRTFITLKELKRSPSSQLEDLLNLCWPLNPVTALCLGPISKRSYGQNQRSIFSFLTSNEPLGLKEFLEKTQVPEEIPYDVSHLWDYLELNWGSAIAVSGDSHHFANVKDALSRLEALEDSKAEHSKIIKVISILELTQQLTGLAPSNDALQIALNLSRHKISRYTNYLSENSLIIFKKYKNAFALYEGSDFNIDEEMEEALKTASRIKLSSVSEQFLPGEVIAKRHYLKTGTLRWSAIKMCAVNEAEEIINSFKPNPNKFGLFLIIDTVDTKEFQSLVEAHQDNYFVIFGQNTLHTDLHDYLAEFIALKMITQNSNALLKDKVARREVNDRSEAIHNIIEGYFVEAAFNANWLINDQIQQADSLTKLSSDLADSIFKAAPIIKNELINRTKTSGSANSALKALMNILITDINSENLGFKKFPAERGIYESVIKNNNLHFNLSGEHRLMNPLKLSTELDKGQFKAIWTATTNFLKANSDRKVTLTEVHSLWSSPPFGLKAGIFPLLSVLFYLSNKNELAYYREEIFVTKIQDFDVDYFLRTPALIQLRWMSMDQKSRALLTALSTIPSEIKNEPVLSIEPLEVATALVSTFDEIEPWSKRTASVSVNAKSVRALFKRASDPAQFTLNDLPKMYGDIDVENNQELSELVSKIKDGLLELRNVFENTINRFKDYTLLELGIPSISESSLQELNERAKEIKGLSGDNKLESFIGQLSMVNQDNSTFEELAWRILSKPTKLWIDQDIDRLFVETIKLCRDFKNIETMSSLKNRREASYAFALLQHSKGKACQEKTTTYHLTDNELNNARAICQKLKSIKSNNGKKISQKELLAALSLIAVEE